MLPSQEVMIIAQIILDVALLAGLALLIAWFKNASKGPDGKKLYRSAEEFLSAGEELADRFETNLREKKKLINELTVELDRRAEGLRALIARAEKAAETPPPDLAQTPPHLTGLGQKAMTVIGMHRQGLTANEIAARTRITKGEIETILAINKIP